MNFNKTYIVVIAIIKYLTMKYLICSKNMSEIINK